MEDRLCVRLLTGVRLLTMGSGSNKQANVQVSAPLRTSQPPPILHKLCTSVHYTPSMYHAHAGKKTKGKKELQFIRCLFSKFTRILPGCSTHSNPVLRTARPSRCAKGSREPRVHSTADFQLGLSGDKASASSAGAGPTGPAGVSKCGFGRDKPL